MAAQEANTVSSATLRTPGAIGLAVIITNDYSNSPAAAAASLGLERLNGAHLDGSALSSAFTELRFAVCWIKNANRHSLGSVLHELRNLKFPTVKNYRCILFIFAGHGCEGDQLIMQDGSKFRVIPDIVDPLLPKNSRDIGSIQKIFLIDACRGRDKTQTILVPRSVAERGGSLIGMQDVAREGGFMLAYSTLPQCKAYEDPHRGGLWFSTLARLLRERSVHLCSIENLLTQVNTELNARMHGSQFQQPEKLSRLNKIICLNPECSCSSGAAAISSSSESTAIPRPGNLIGRPPAPPQLKQKLGSQNMQGYYRGQLNNYHQTGFIAQQPEYSDAVQDSASRFSVSVSVTLSSSGQVIVGRGAQENTINAAKESAARDACNKIQKACGAQGRGGATVSAPPPKKKASPDPKTGKSKLKEYFEAQGKLNAVVYKTVPEGTGFRCTLTCPMLGRVTGELCLSKKEAEHSAARKALNKLP